MKLAKRLITFIIIAVMAMAMGACTSCSMFKEDTAVTAYEIAVKNGFVGTEAEWLESLRGPNGANASTVYKSLYEEAKENGFVGSFDDFITKYLSDYINNQSQNSISAATAKAIRSVVSVYSTFSYTSEYYDRYGKHEEIEEYSGAGSGVIVQLDEDGNGYVITNFHVIYDSNDDDGYADKIELYVYGSELSALSVSAEIVGATATYDLALLKVTESEVFRTTNVAAATFENSDNLVPGAQILAIGNPEAAGIAVTEGIVSVDSEYITMTSPKDGSSTERYRTIRIDAAVNGGNSGGGLFDINGNLVGIVNAKVVSSSVDNIAYAIPSSIVEKVYANILRNCDGANKSLKVCRIGVTIKIDNSYAEYNDELGTVKTVHVIKVESVADGTSATGKLKAGDVIKSFEYEGKTVKVEKMYTLTDSVLYFEKDKVVTFTVIRDGAEVKIPVTLLNEEVID